MIELPLIFVAGFMGSAHCIGMCGPFALLLGASEQTWKSGLTRQIHYSLGRIFTYAVLGACAGFCGLRLAETSSLLVNFPAVISIVAGLFLVYQGLITAGVIQRVRISQAASSSPCLAGGILGNFLRSTSSFDIFLAGVFTGFLPCGLVYGFLGMAASTQHVAMGTLTMVAFGLGTVPIMVATGCGGRLLSITTRRRLLQIAAWCIVGAGIVTMVRGAGFLQSGGQAVVESCPMCN